jgi:hypothetical protein
LFFSCEKSLEFHEYIESLDENLAIQYPETGSYGLNVLSDGFVTAQRTGLGRFEYSVKAVVPAGISSLKIVIKTKVPLFTCYQCKSTFAEWNGKCPICDDEYSCSEYGWGGFNQDSEKNWLVTNINSYFTFAIVENGKPADASVIFNRDCFIEYYENGATEPTKVKEIKVID